MTRPELCNNAVNRHEHLVEEPRISESTLSSPQVLGIVEPELRTPSANRFVGHGDFSFGEYILYVSEADTESVVEPDCVADDFAWLTVPAIAGSRGVHAPKWSKLTMPSGGMPRGTWIEMQHWVPSGCGPGKQVHFRVGAGYYLD